MDSSPSGRPSTAAPGHMRMASGLLPDWLSQRMLRRDRERADYPQPGASSTRRVVTARAPFAVIAVMRIAAVTGWRPYQR